MTDLVSHCQGLFKFADNLALFLTILAMVFFLVAGYFLIQQARIELDRLKAAPQPDAAKVRSLAGAAAEVVEALPNLVNALAKAPAPIVMLILGILLITVPNAEPGATCLAAFEASKDAG